MVDSTPLSRLIEKLPPDDPQRSPLMTGKQVADVTGITYRRIDYWDRISLLSPTGEATGSGSRRGYSFADAVGLAMIDAFSTGGHALQLLRPMVEQLATVPDASLDQAMVFFAPGGEVRVTVDRADTRAAFESMLTTHRGMVSVLPANAAVAQVRAGVHRTFEQAPWRVDAILGGAPTPVRGVER